MKRWYLAIIASVIVLAGFRSAYAAWSGNCIRYSNFFTGTLQNCQICPPSGTFPCVATVHALASRIGIACLGGPENYFEGTTQGRENAQVMAPSPGVATVSGIEAMESVNSMGVVNGSCINAGFTSVPYGCGNTFWLDVDCGYQGLGSP